MPPVIATAGHVDHGKSSLVRALTGVDPDRLAEERRRGLTIELGFVHASVHGQPVSFVDVPGHARFIRTMLSGAAAVDGVVFVVDGAEGWKPQSEEHLRILELLGVATGVVAVAKIDLVDAARLADAVAGVRARLTGTFLEAAPIVPVSIVTGEGLDVLAGAIGLMAAGAASVRKASFRARLWIDRAFTIRGSGTVVTGTTNEGAFAVGDRVSITPGCARARIRGIHVAQARVESVQARTRAALNLVGVAVHEVGRGQAVVTPGAWWSTDMFDASLRVLSQYANPVTRRGAFLAYVGSAEHPVALRVLGGERIEAGAAGLVRLRLDTVLALTTRDRYVLRDAGRDLTIGGGEVLDVAPVMPAGLARPDRSLDRIVAERGWVAVADLERMTGERRAATIGGWVVASDELARAHRAFVARVAAAADRGLDVAALDPHERALAADAELATMEAGRVYRRGAGPGPENHPALAALVAGGLTPPAPAAADRGVLRDLVRRGVVVERDGVWFAAEAVERAVQIVVGLLARLPDGFTVAEFRDEAGLTRKYALALLGELDGRAVTRRRGDLRVAGARIPPRPPER